MPDTQAFIDILHELRANGAQADRSVEAFLNGSDVAASEERTCSAAELIELPTRNLTNTRKHKRYKQQCLSGSPRSCLHSLLPLASQKLDLAKICPYNYLFGSAERLAESLKSSTDFEESRMSLCFKCCTDFEESRALIRIPDLIFATWRRGIKARSCHIYASGLVWLSLITLLAVIMPALTRLPGAEPLTTPIKSFHWIEQVLGKPARTTKRVESKRVS